jgi:hypothetical protein
LTVSETLNYEIEKVLLGVREETGELRRGDTDGGEQRVVGRRGATSAVDWPTTTPPTSSR